jgi:hypothetical protein
MNVEDLLKEINVLKEENTELKNHLKKYTAPTRSKTYYENHKDEIMQRNKEYKEKTNYEYVVSPEKKKRIRKNSVFE